MPDAVRLRRRRARSRRRPARRHRRARRTLAAARASSCSKTTAARWPTPTSNCSRPTGADRRRHSCRGRLPRPARWRRVVRRARRNRRIDAPQRIDLRTRRGASGTPSDATVFAQARALLHWHARHRFCGACGGEVAFVRAGWLGRCPQCGSEHYPRTDQAMIAAVTDGQRLLLGRQASWPARRYSVLAGFVEPGESLEQTVAREVFEEAGVRVRGVPLPGLAAVAVPGLADARLHGPRRPGRAGHWRRTRGRPLVRRRRGPRRPGARRQRIRCRTTTPASCCRRRSRSRAGWWSSGWRRWTAAA